MGSTIDKIFLSAEMQDQTYRALDTDLTDVIVRLKNGDEYTASFFSFNKVNQTINGYRRNGLNLSGKYFWFPNMFLIEDCSRKSIEAVVNHLVENGDFWQVFGKV